MSSKEQGVRGVGAAIATALLVVAIVFFIAATGPSRKPASGSLVASGTTFVTEAATFELLPHEARVVMKSTGGVARAFDLVLAVDGTIRPLSMARAGLKRSRDTITAQVPVDAGDVHVTANLSFTLEGTDALLVEASLDGAPTDDSHDLALQIQNAPARSVFVPGTGEIADLGAVSARSVILDDDDHPAAIVSAGGNLACALDPEDKDMEKSPMRLRVEASANLGEEPTEAGAEPDVSEDAGPTDDMRHADPSDLRVFLVAGASTPKIWGRVHSLLHEDTARVAGVVTGARERARVYGMDEEGRVTVRARVDADQRFSLEVPKNVTSWYAAIDSADTSAPTRFEPGTGWDLKLDVSQGGELHVRVIDADTQKPLVARLVVHGIDGTMDPSFGPDFRASGAGPIIDSLQGEVRTPLPAGRYRVLATKGIEWSVGAESIEITSGRAKVVQLALRHVVPTPDWIACDLHVHARPSFDAPVMQEDRVLSLVAAGVEFAVPTEHNIVGDYSPSVELLGLQDQFSTVTGVEVTTFVPRFGHFGIYPYPVGPPPPFRATTAAAIFGAAHKDPKRVLTIHHPRLPLGIGYFSVEGFDPRNPRNSPRVRKDFDAIEVYNGYDEMNRGRVEEVLKDYYGLLSIGRYAATGSSDSHRIQYQWAGYPRTYARIDPDHGGDGAHPVDTTAVVASIKHARLMVTSGPLIELDVNGAQPGDETDVHGKTVNAHVRVRAAPWVDVTSLEIIVGGKSVLTIPIPSRPTSIEPELGTLEEAENRTIRLEQDIDVPLPVNQAQTNGQTNNGQTNNNAASGDTDTTWILAVARGDRKLDDVLPFMPVSPLGFTNPIWLRRAK